MSCAAGGRTPHQIGHSYVLTESPPPSKYFRSVRYVRISRPALPSSPCPCANCVASIPYPERRSDDQLAISKSRNQSRVRTGESAHNPYSRPIRESHSFRPVQAHATSCRCPNCALHPCKKTNLEHAPRAVTRTNQSRSRLVCPVPSRSTCGAHWSAGPYHSRPSTPNRNPLPLRSASSLRRLSANSDNHLAPCVDSRACTASQNSPESPDIECSPQPVVRPRAARTA